MFTKKYHYMCPYRFPYRFTTGLRQVILLLNFNISLSILDAHCRQRQSFAILLNNSGVELGSLLHWCSAFAATAMSAALAGSSWVLCIIWFRLRGRRILFSLACEVLGSTSDVKVFDPPCLTCNDNTDHLATLHLTALGRLAFPFFVLSVSVS